MQSKDALDLDNGQRTIYFVLLVLMIIWLLAVQTSSCSTYVCIILVWGRLSSVSVS